MYDYQKKKRKYRIEWQEFFELSNYYAKNFEHFDNNECIEYFNNNNYSKILMPS